jgi:hypothetical protein
VLIFDVIAEQRIQEAQARGEFDNLPGAGCPQNFDDDPLLPEDLRVAYRMLKNAGFVPPEVEARREAANLRWLIAKLDDEIERRKALAKLQLLNIRIATSNKRTFSIEPIYYEQILEKLTGDAGDLGK